MNRTSTSPSTSRPAPWRPDSVRFFPTRKDLRNWFEANHAAASEVWVGFYKTGSHRTGLVYRDAVEEALCFGWIDTTVRRIDEERYANRFVPRRAGSRWSEGNRTLFRRLVRERRVAPAGRAAFAGRAGKTEHSRER